jgi:hypothetical protein
MAKYVQFFVFAVCIVNACSALAIIPKPKEITDPSQSWTIQSANKCAIVIGNSAREPEAYSAEILHKWISRRFHKKCDIKTESQPLSGYSYLFVLGVRANNALLDQLATANSIELGPNSPGFNGYIIEMVESGQQNIALVGGSDQSGVVYGQNTLFQLMEKQNGSIKLNHAFIRDWPSIKRRGSHKHPFTSYLEQGMMDLYVMGRFNTADLRNGSYGGGEDTMDSTQAVQFVDMAHKRGFYVWGSMSAIVGSGSAIDRKIGFCDKYVDAYGVDGVWANVDDAGEGSFTETFLDTFVRWGYAKGLKGSDMMILPPQYPRGYEGIKGSWNEGILSAVPQTKTVQWIYTCPPDEQSAADAAELGHAFKPYWWINSPGSDVGLSYYPQFGNRSTPNLQVVPKDAFYREFIDFSKHGWTYQLDFEGETMRSAASCIEGASQWPYALMQEEYVYMNLGAWYWNPEEYVMADARRYVYETVFGRERADIGLEFDSCLVAVKPHFDLFIDCPRPPDFIGDRAVAESLAQQMCQCVANLSDNPFTMVDSARYQTRYIQGMEKVVRIVYDYLGMSYSPCQSTVARRSTVRPPSRMNVRVYPNPFSTSVDIFVRGPFRRRRITRHEVRLEVFNIAGKMVANIKSRAISDERRATSYAWNATNHPSGIYIIRVKAGGKVFERRMTLVR